MNDVQCASRREWLRTAGRNLILGGMLAGIGLLSARRGDGCPRKELCAGCPAMRSCLLPAGRRARRHKLRNRR